MKDHVRSVMRAQGRIPDAVRVVNVLDDHEMERLRGYRGVDYAYDHTAYDRLHAERLAKVEAYLGA